MSARAALREASQPRRGLSRVEAASYVGIGATLFDAMVRDGRMPSPIRIAGRVLWDIRALDVAFDRLSGHAQHETNEWDS